MSFPRGWTKTSSPGAGNVASIVVPGITGVSHVLDSFEARVSSSLTTGPVQWEILLTSSDLVFNALVIGWLFANAAASATNVVVDTESATGLDMAAGPGASMTVAFQFASAAVIPFLRIQGHDI